MWWSWLFNLGCKVLNSNPCGAFHTSAYWTLGFGEGGLHSKTLITATAYEIAWLLMRLLMSVGRALQLWSSSLLHNWLYSPLPISKCISARGRVYSTWNFCYMDSSVLTCNLKRYFILKMTGRKGRVVSNDDGSISYESRSELDVPVEILNITEKQRFMDGDKVHVFLYYFERF